MDGRTNSFSPSILPSRNLFILGDFNCHHPLWDSRGTSDPRRDEVFDCVISSDLLPFNDPDTPILHHHSSGSRSSPDISFAPSTLAPGRCYRTWVLTIYQFFYLSLSPWSFAPMSIPLPSIFRKLTGMTLPLILTLTVLLLPECLSLSSTAALFTFLALNVAKSSIPFGCIKRHPKAWWSAEVETAISERHKVFAATHRNDENRQAYISTSRCALSVIAKAKAEALQMTFSSLSPTSNLKCIHSLLRSIADSPSSSSSSPNFPNCSSHRESASVYAAYLRFHFSVSQPKALHRRARGYLSGLCRAAWPVEPHPFFCSPFSLAEFFVAASNLSLLHHNWPRQSCLSHAKAPSLLWHGFSSSHLQSLLVFTFLSFHLEDIFYYSHSQDGKASRLSCFPLAYLSHLLHIKAF